MRTWVSTSGSFSEGRGAARWRWPMREAYPERCSALVLRGIFLCRPLEIDWFLNGMRLVFPEVWRHFSDHIPGTSATICWRPIPGG